MQKSSNRICQHSLHRDKVSGFKVFRAGRDHRNANLTRDIADYYYDEYLFSEEEKLSIEKDISLCQLPLDWNSFQVEEVIADYFDRFVVMNNIPFRD